ncbi:carbohydrate ABC transporter permease [Paenibacillus solisilvae]|uniref:Carbohydrate ABC transporter permease n=1 Tax=Paenibacillus solisilvae TaxID=2486751 RepID=A0ABW0WAI7_9BACL
MRQIGRSKMIIPFVAPALLVYVVFFVFPAIQALWVSFHEWSGFVPKMKFVGLSNFKELLKDDMFLMSLKNTLTITFIGGFFVVGLALLFAGMLNRTNLKGSKVIRSIIFYPNVVPAVGLGVLWVFMYNNDFGLINGILKLFGLSSFAHVWLDTTWAFTSVLVAMIWAYVGFYLVILQAGINKIPNTLYEAAEVEGAGYWTVFRTITIPLIWDSLMVVVVLWLINSVKAFDLIYAMTEGGPSGTTQTVSIYLYDMAFGKRVAIFRMGYGTAMAVFLLILVIIGTSIIRMVSRREKIEF